MYDSNMTVILNLFPKQLLETRPKFIVNEEFKG